MSSEAENDRPSRTSWTRQGLSLLFAGLAAVVPIVGTIWLLLVIYRVLLAVGKAIIYAVVYFLDVLRGVKFEKNDSGEQVATGDLGAWVEVLFGETATTWFWSIVPVALLFVVGVAVTNRPGKKVLNWLEQALIRIPLMGFVYSTLKQGVDALRDLGGDKQKFKGVAYVEYPSEGCRMLGFITGNYRDSQTGKDVTSVFLPTSPNPMTGFIIIIDDEKVHNSDLTIEQASKLILSAGLVGPEVTGKSQYQMRQESSPEPEAKDA